MPPDGFHGDDHTTTRPRARPKISGAEAATREILAGLSQPQKTLPAKLFYDDEGCRLFGLITGLDEYYLTRTETALLDAHAGEIASFAPPASALVEYGASDEAKAQYLLGTGRFSAYVPIDIAPGALADLSLRLKGSRPALEVLPLVADFMGPVTLPAAIADRSRFGFFPGSTIGNLDPDAVIAFLTRVRHALAAPALAGPDGGARLVIGADLRKDQSILIPAYDDSRGVTAAFNRNMLTHVNRISGSAFDPEAFDHVARWNDRAGRIEMHLVSVARQRVTIAGRTIDFRPGESIHTESSYKHTRDGLLELADRAGWRACAFWTDPDALFGIHLLESHA